jgi:hypothetical protein
MRPNFNLTRGETSLASVQEEVKKTFLSLGDDTVCKHIGKRDIATAETMVAHGLGRIPSGWQTYSPEGFGNVKESKAPDDRFLYLIADVAVRVGLKAW